MYLSIHGTDFKYLFCFLKYNKAEQVICKECKMKNKKNIVAVLAILILMVSTMVLFTACDHYYQFRLAGVWEVKKATALGISLDLPIKDLGVTTYMYLYFTRDGKGGIVKKIAGGGISSLSKYDEFEYSVNGKNIIFKRNGIESSGDFELIFNKLILTENLEGDKAIFEAEKTHSPSLQAIENAPKK